MHYKEMVVWQKAMTLVEEVYKITACLPKQEQFGLASQMQRAAVSIPSNIAEGQSRHSKKEYLHFVSIAQGSKAELYTQIQICVRLGFLSLEDTEKTSMICEEVGKMLYALANKLRQE